MLFNSFCYVIFFLATFCIYYLLPHRYRWIALAGASYVYYMLSVPAFGLVLLLITAVHYGAAILIDRAPDKRTKRIYLYLSTAISLCTLLLLKYASPSAYISGRPGWAGGIFGLHQALSSWSATARILMPIGISFYTLQAISYTTDVFNGTAKPEKNFGRFALFMAYFPKLLLGPVERAANFIPRLAAKVEFNKAAIASGMRLILWGYFKKLVIGDRIALFIDPVFMNPLHADTHSLWLAFLLYPVQVYADFSGYIDIARGCSRMLGIELSVNFDLPLFSRSMSEFWRKWNMSISSWFRDYVFYPLYLKIKRLGIRSQNTNRQHNFSLTISLILMFLLLGLWHGLKWTFIMAGLLQAACIIAETYLPLLPSKSPRRNLTIIRALYTLKTYLLFCFITLFFRSQSVTWALLHFRSLFMDSVSGASGALQSWLPYSIGVDPLFILVLINCAAMLAGEYLLARSKWAAGLIAESLTLRLSIYMVLIMQIIYAGISYPSEGFQYMQF